MKVCTIMASLSMPPSLHDKKGTKSRQAIRLECERAFAGLELDPANLYHVTLTFYGDWLDKKGQPSSKRPDTLNLAKVIEDEIYRCVALNDRHNFKYSIEKLEGEPACEVFIAPLRAIS